MVDDTDLGRRDPRSLGVALPAARHDGISMDGPYSFEDRVYAGPFRVKSLHGATVSKNEMQELGSVKLGQDVLDAATYTIH